MKYNKWIYGILLVSLVFTTSSCLFYKTVSEDVISAETIAAHAKQKQYITIQEAGSSMTYLLEGYSLENNMLSGSIKPITEPDHPSDKDVFLMSKGKHAKSYLHLYTTSALAAGAIKIPVSEISGMKRHATEFISTIFATTALTAVAVLVAAVAFVAIACSCPHVATINPDGSTVFQGSLFPGAIFKSLKRKDFLVLNNVNSDKDDVITVQVFNDLDEVQYIDQVGLLAVQHSESHLGLLQNAKLMAYNVGELPLSGTSQTENNVLDHIIGRDNISYNFDDPAIERQLNSLVLNFKSSELDEKSLLVIRGQQTELLEHTAEVFFQQFGTKFPSWVEEMNHKEATNYNQNSINQGISLNAYVMTKGEWEFIGNFENVGAMAKRDLAIPIDISPIESEISIKLEAAYGFWSIDQITLTSDWSTDLKTEALSLISAVNQDMEDVKKRLDDADEDYLIQRLKGTSTNLKFKALPTINSTYVLTGTGYYNHEREYTNAPNYKFLKKMKRMRHSTHELAQIVQLYEDMHIASNN